MATGTGAVENEILKDWEEERECSAHLPKGTQIEERSGLVETERIDFHRSRKGIA